MTEVALMQKGGRFDHLGVLPAAKKIIEIFI
jgi:hypothetical protein